MSTPNRDANCAVRLGFCPSAMLLVGVHMIATAQRFHARIAQNKLWLRTRWSGVRIPPGAQINQQVTSEAGADCTPKNRPVPLMRAANWLRYQASPQVWEDRTAPPPDMNLHSFVRTTLCVFLLVEVLNVISMVRGVAGVWMSGGVG